MTIEANKQLINGVAKRAGKPLMDAVIGSLQETDPLFSLSDPRSLELLLARLNDVTRAGDQAVKTATNDGELKPGAATAHLVSDVYKKNAKGKFRYNRTISSVREIFEPAAQNRLEELRTQDRLG